MAARTPSGGYHYYFTYPDDEVHNSSQQPAGTRLDVRGEGGQVNAPPTTRRRFPLPMWPKRREP